MAQSKRDCNIATLTASGHLNVILVSYLSWVTNVWCMDKD